MNSVSAPFFSIVLPTHDRRELMRTNLQCLRMAGFDDCEFVISDNATDDSTAIKEDFDELVGDDKRFKYYRTEKCVSASINYERVYRKASGRYVTFLKDHYILYPESLEIIYRLIRENNFPPVVSWNSDLYRFQDYERGLMGCIHKTNQNVFSKTFKYDSFDDVIWTNKSLKAWNDGENPGSRCRSNFIEGRAFVRRDLLDEYERIFGTLTWAIGTDFACRYIISILARNEACLFIRKAFLLDLYIPNNSGRIVTSSFENIKKLFQTPLSEITTKNADYNASLSFCNKMEANLEYDIICQIEYINKILVKNGILEMPCRLDRAYALYMIRKEYSDDLRIRHWIIPDVELDRIRENLKDALWSFSRREKKVYYWHIVKEIFFQLWIIGKIRTSVILIIFGYKKLRNRQISSEEENKYYNSPLEYIQERIERDGS